MSDFFQKEPLRPAVPFRKRVELVHLAVQTRKLTHELRTGQAAEVVLVCKLSKDAPTLGLDLRGGRECVRRSTHVILLGSVETLANLPGPLVHVLVHAAVHLFQVVEVEPSWYWVSFQLCDAKRGERFLTLLEVFRRTGTYQIAIGARS